MRIPGTQPRSLSTVGKPSTPIPIVDLIPMTLARNLHCQSMRVYDYSSVLHLETTGMTHIYPVAA